MKIEIAKIDLENALQVVGICLAANGSDISTHYVFRVTAVEDGTDDGTYQAEVLASRDQVFSGMPLLAQVTVEDDDQPVTGKIWYGFTVEGKRLDMWLKGFGDASLTFTYKHDKRVVTAKTARGSQRFQSLDPSMFRDWDAQMLQAKKTATVAAPRLLAALSHSKEYASTDESRKPEICVVEAREGVLMAMDMVSASRVTMPDLKDCTLRIHHKNLAGFQAFLNACKEADINILEEADRTLFFQRSDGKALHGETRFRAVFPDLNKPGPVDQHTWEISSDELLTAIPFLKSGASQEDIRLRLDRKDGGPLSLSMRRTTGGSATLDIPILSSDSPAQESVDGTDEPVPLPDGGFIISPDALKKIVKSFPGDTVTLGITRLPLPPDQWEKPGVPTYSNRGYTRFYWEAFGPEDAGEEGDDLVDLPKADEYVTVLAWLR